jgi:predicted DNA-binding protein
VTTKLPKSFRFSAETIEMLEALSHHLGISQTSVLEMLIRQHAREEGVVSLSVKKGRTNSPYHRNG